MNVTPADKPMEWTAALIGLGTAIAAFLSGHDYIALAAGIGGTVPVLVTALATYFPRFARLRPAEIASAIAGIIAAVVLYAGNRDLAALTSGILAFVPALATLLVAAKDPSKAELAAG
jgi:peptidoglycan/LPS O-acetylase OafA/YrhL